MPFVWEQGEHVAIIGENGSGKTFLETRLVEFRDYVAVLKTKADDTKFNGFRVAKKATALDNPNNNRILLRPNYYDQAKQGWWMLEKAWQQGGWTCVIDELLRCERIGLTDQIERGLTQGRSIKISMVVGTQRPARITRYALSEAKHVFSFALEGRDAKVLSESTSEGMERAVLGLARYQFAYYYRPTREITIGRAQDLAKIFPSNALDRGDGVLQRAESQGRGLFRRIPIPRVGERG